MLDNNNSGEPITHRDVANLSNAIERLTSVVNALAVEIANTYVRKDVLDPKLEDIKGQMSDIRKDVSGLNDWLTWATRIALGMVIVAVIGLALRQGS